MFCTFFWTLISFFCHSNYLSCKVRCPCLVVFSKLLDAWLSCLLVSFRIILFMICWSFWICLCLFPNLRHLQSFTNTFQPYCLLISCNSIDTNRRSFVTPTDLWGGSVHFFFFACLLYVVQIGWFLSFYAQSHWFIPLSLQFCCQTHPVI